MEQVKKDIHNKCVRVRACVRARGRLCACVRQSVFANARTFRCVAISPCSAAISASRPRPAPAPPPLLRDRAFAPQRSAHVGWPLVGRAPTAPLFGPPAPLGAPPCRVGPGAATDCIYSPPIPPLPPPSALTAIPSPPPHLPLSPTAIPSPPPPLPLCPTAFPALTGRCFSGQVVSFFFPPQKTVDLQPPSVTLPPPSVARQPPLDTSNRRPMVCLHTEAVTGRPEFLFCFEYKILRALPPPSATHSLPMPTQCPPPTPPPSLAWHPPSGSTG